MTTFLAGPARLVALVVQAAVAFTAFGGGAALVVGALVGIPAGAMTPPDGFLAGSPFTGYLVPGLLLAVVIGGLHLGSFLLTLQRSPWGQLASAIAAFALLIWIFVQMIWIPFSPLQAVYEGLAIAELASLLVQHGLLDMLAPARPTEHPHATDRGASSRQRTA